MGHGTYLTKRKYLEAQELYTFLMSLRARGFLFHLHADLLTVEESFHSHELKAILFVRVEKAHEADLHCVDWNTHNENLILTG
jgi:hypothetical protein